MLYADTNRRSEQSPLLRQAISVAETHHSAVGTSRPLLDVLEAGGLTLPAAEFISAPRPAPIVPLTPPYLIREKAVTMAKTIGYFASTCGVIGAMNSLAAPGIYSSAKMDYSTLVALRDGTVGAGIIGAAVALVGASTSTVAGLNCDAWNTRDLALGWLSWLALDMVFAGSLGRCVFSGAAAKGPSLIASPLLGTEIAVALLLPVGLVGGPIVASYDSNASLGINCCNATYILGAGTVVLATMSTVFGACNALSAACFFKGGLLPIYPSIDYPAANAFDDGLIGAAICFSIVWGVAGLIVTAVRVLALSERQPDYPLIGRIGLVTGGVLSGLWAASFGYAIRTGNDTLRGEHGESTHLYFMPVLGALVIIASQQK